MRASSTRTSMIGYARGGGDDLERQVAALRAIGVPESALFVDQDDPKLPRLDAAISRARCSNDAILVIERLDRLGTNLRGVLDMVARMLISKINLRSLHEDIDSRDPSSLKIFMRIADLARVERVLIAEAAAAGLKAARARGGGAGRPDLMTPERAATARAMLFPTDGSPPATKEATARAIGVSRSKIYLWLRHEAARNREAAANQRHEDMP